MNSAKMIYVYRILALMSLQSSVNKRLTHLFLHLGLPVVQCFVKTNTINKAGEQCVIITKQKNSLSKHIMREQFLFCCQTVHVAASCDFLDTYTFFALHFPTTKKSLAGA